MRSGMRCSCLSTCGPGAWGVVWILEMPSRLNLFDQPELSCTRIIP